jgi:hypothetical protein
MKKRSGYNIYYLDDSFEDITIVSNYIKKKLGIKILPEKDRWQDDLDVFTRYLVEDSQGSRDRVNELLNERPLSLIILDQEICGQSSAGGRIADEFILDEENFNDLKIILFSGATDKQKSTKYYDTNQQINLSKGGDTKKAAKVLIKGIEQLLKLEGETFAEFLKRLNEDIKI